MSPLKSLALCVILASTSPIVAVSAEPAKGPTVLDVKQAEARKFEANQTQIGYSSTRVFYTLAAQKAVVMIHLDNKPAGGKGAAFPATGTVYRFAPDVTPDGLAKWLNNQHSDGLFPEVPEPTATFKLPAGSCKTSSQKRVGREDPGIGAYDKYAVEFQVSEVKIDAGLQLASFKDAANVFVKVE